MAPIVEVERIEKAFKQVRALCGLDLVVPEGQVVGLLGPNGAGKTTLVRILSTLLKPDGGRARIAGFDVEREPMRVRRTIGVAGQFSALDDALTGRENLEMIGRLCRLGASTAKRRAQEVLEKVSLDDAANHLVRTYSGGMKRRLDLGASLVANPPVLLLDEPTTGLDPRGRIELWAYLRQLVDEGTSLLLTTQYLEEADQMADEIVVIDHGVVIASGTSTELKQRVGGEVLEVTLLDTADIARAADALAPLGTDAPHTDEETKAVSVAVNGGAERLIEAAKRLDEATVGVADLALRRPSLDDAFLALTGHAAEEPATDGNHD
jgi:ABC-2 type transport system ATP-binding protein